MKTSFIAWIECQCGSLLVCNVYFCQGGRVFSAVCPFVCLHDYANTNSWDLVAGYNIGQGRTHYMFEHIQIMWWIHKVFFIIGNIAR